MIDICLLHQFWIKPRVQSPQLGGTSMSVDCHSIEDIEDHFPGKWETRASRSVQCQARWHFHLGRREGFLTYMALPGPSDHKKQKTCSDFYSCFSTMNTGQSCCCCCSCCRLLTTAIKVSFGESRGQSAERIIHYFTIKYCQPQNAILNQIDNEADGKWFPPSVFTGLFGTVHAWEIPNIRTLTEGTAVRVAVWLSSVASWTTASMPKHDSEGQALRCGQMQPTRDWGGAWQAVYNSLQEIPQAAYFRKQYFRDRKGA